MADEGIRKRGETLSDVVERSPRSALVYSKWLSLQASETKRIVGVDAVPCLLHELRTSDPGRREIAYSMLTRFAGEGQSRAAREAVEKLAGDSKDPLQRHAQLFLEMPTEAGH